MDATSDEQQHHHHARREQPGRGPSAGDGDVGHSHPGPGGQPGHRHPHPPDDPSGRPRIGVVGAGRVGTCLGVAFSRAGWPVVAVSSRSPQRRERFTALVPSARAVEESQSLVEVVDLVFLTVPDDALSRVAAGIRLYGGQGIVHTSGALGASVLDPARAAGTLAASFHPMVAFADLEAALVALRASTVALEGDEELLVTLADLARDVGAEPVRLPPAGKAAYHAAAVLAAGGFVGLLDAIAEVARGAGLDEAGALAIYGPLIRQSLANAERQGIQDALTGPFVRGDEGTVRDHLAALERLAPGALELYRAVARRELALAERRRDLDPGSVRAMRRLLE